MSYEDLKDSDKQRLAAAFVNIKDKRSAMAKIDWETATLSFKPDATITGESFKTSISRIKGGFTTLTAPDKHRLAASFCSLQSSDDYKAVMANVNWNKAATDFKPSGKPITSDSFRTSIQRMLKDKSGGSRRTGNTGKKRKAPAVEHSPSTDDSEQKRAKKSNIGQAISPAPSGPAAEGDTEKEDNQSIRSSQKPSPSPPAKSEAEDDDTPADHALGEEDSKSF